MSHKSKFLTGGYIEDDVRDSYRDSEYRTKAWLAYF